MQPLANNDTCKSGVCSPILAFLLLLLHIVRHPFSLLNRRSIEYSFSIIAYIHSVDAYAWGSFRMLMTVRVHSKVTKTPLCNYVLIIIMLAQSAYHEGSDTEYPQSNSISILGAFITMSIKLKWPATADKLLNIKAVHNTFYPLAR